MNVEKVTDYIVKWLKDYAINAKVNGFVVGVSGGIDSAVTSTLCAMTGKPTYLLSLPIHQNEKELERAEKRLKGIENVKPEYQEEYERLESELERFYSIYVEKFTNIDYLEYELDMYNLKDVKRRAEQADVINKFKSQ